jgi:hypothetical protein
MEPLYKNSYTERCQRRKKKEDIYIFETLVGSISHTSLSSSIANGITFYAGNYCVDNAGKLVDDFCFGGCTTKTHTPTLYEMKHFVIIR